MGLKDFVRIPIPHRGWKTRSRDLRKGLALMWRGTLLVLGLMIPSPGRWGAFLAGWGAAFGAAGLVVFTHEAQGQRWVIVGGVAVVTCLIAYRCEPHVRWSTDGLWIHLGALAVTIPLVLAFSFIALPVTQFVLVLGACALLLWFFFSGDSTHEVTDVRRGANSHVNRDGRPKVGYSGEADAWNAAWSFEADTGERMSVYRCATCPDWHIGHARP